MQLIRASLPDSRSGQTKVLWFSERSRDGFVIVVFVIVTHGTSVPLSRRTHDYLELISQPRHSHIQCI